MSESVDDLASFEEAIKHISDGQYVLKLYVSGSSPRSAKAIANVRAICDQYLSGRCNLEIIDVYQQPDLARDNQLLAAPTLIKESPIPPRRLVGDMSDEDRVLYSLNIVKSRDE